MPQEALITIATRHQSHYERLKSSEVAKFDDFLRKMDRDIRKQLADVEITALTRKKLELQLRDIRALLKGTLDDYSKVWYDSINEAAIYEAGFEVRALGNVVSGVSFTLPSDAAITAAVFNSPLGNIGGPDGGSLLEPLLDGMSERTIKRVEGAIRIGYAQGQTTNEILQRIRGTRAAGFRDGIMANINRDAEAITRTALQHAASMARNEVWQANSDVIKSVRWVSTLDDRTSAQCFIGSTKVQLAGKLENVFRANYSGEIIIITTASGKKLEGTPNHPVLTLGGFLPLHELKPGDKVINATFNHGVVIHGDEDICVPANIGKVFDSFNKPSIFDVSRKSASAIDFYGDGKGMNGEIDIISTHSHLRGNSVTCNSQGVKDKLFSFIKASISLARHSNCSDLSIGEGVSEMPTKIGVVDLQKFIDQSFWTFEDACDFDWLKSIIKQLDSSDFISETTLGSLSSLKIFHDSMLLKQGGDSSSCNTEISTKLGSGTAFTVEPDNIISVVSEFRNCHVYTLSSSLGLYTAEGIIVKNCQALDGQEYPIDEGPRPPAHINACLKGTRVLTRRGTMPIEHVKVGDYVLTHLDRWCRVRSVMARKHDGLARDLINNFGASVSLTNEHPILTKNKGWVEAGQIEIGDVFFHHAKQFSRLRDAVAVSSLVPQRVLLDAHNIITNLTQELVSYGIFSSSAGMTSAVNLDNRITDNKIGIVSQDATLSSEFNSNSRQNSGENSFMFGRLRNKNFSQGIPRFFDNLNIMRRIVDGHSFGRFFAIRRMKFWHAFSPVDVARWVSDVALIVSNGLNFAFNSNSVSSASTVKGATAKPLFTLNAPNAFSSAKMFLFDKLFSILKRDHVQSSWIAATCSKIEEYHYSGFVYNLAVDGDETYLANGFLVHNCRSSVVAVLVDEFAALSEGRTRSERDPVTGEVGKVSANQTYYGWLKDQPASVQDSIIGPSRGALLRNGGISSERFAELQLGKNFQPLTLSQMRELDPVAFEKAGL